MIDLKLKVKDYCSECPNFVAKTEANRVYSDDMIASHEVIVSCKYEDHCKNLMKHLKKG